MTENLSLLLREQAKQYGQRTAIVSGHHRISYASLDDDSNRLANALIQMGVKKGDRVAILLLNGLEFVVSLFAVTKVGAIAVPLDVRYKVDELASVLDNCQPRALVSESSYLTPLIPSLASLRYIEHVIEVGSTYRGSFHSYHDIMASGSAAEINPEPAPDDIAYIGYTSGPTSHPRGVMLSHRLLILEAGLCGDACRQTEADVVMLFALPMHHVFGLIVIMLSSMLKGSKLVILPGFSLNTFMELIESEKGTIFMGVPYVLALLANMAEQDRIGYDLSSLRLCVSGGAYLPNTVAERFKQYYGLEPIQLWGLTEASAAVTFGPADGIWRCGSAGKLLPGWQAKVLDNNDRELPANQPGEIMVRGLVMNGYYHNPQATAAVMKDGWLRTGDIGRFDEDGYLFIAGRKKRVIIAKGQNIHPEDIEEALHAHPKVAEAVVVGIPDELRGEIVWAAVALREGEATTEEEIKRYCRKLLANYKVPKRVIFLDALPMTIAGEVCRNDMVDYLLALPS